MEASPEIPFSPARRPRTQGLLKNKVGDPSIVERPPEEICKGQVVAKNTIRNSKSKAAEVSTQDYVHTDKGGHQSGATVTDLPLAYCSGGRQVSNLSYKARSLYFDDLISQLAKSTG